MAKENSLVFLSYLLNCTPRELDTTNALIELAAGEHLPTGAEVIIAECMTDPVLAGMLRDYAAKRAKTHFRGYRQHKGKTREQISKDARARRQTLEAKRKHHSGGRPYNAA